MRPSGAGRRPEDTEERLRTLGTDPAYGWEVVRLVRLAEAAPRGLRPGVTRRHVLSAQGPGR